MVSLRPWRRNAEREAEAVVVGVGPNALAALLRVMPMLLLLSGDAGSVVEVGCSESLLKPLLPCTVGSHPFSPLWIVDSASRALWCVCSRGETVGLMVSKLVEDVDLVSGGVPLSVRECRWLWV